MSTFSLEQFQAALLGALPRAFGGKFCVALSGGLDSTVLLRALVALSKSHPDWSVRAIHVDHQLHRDSAAWAQRCAALTMELGAPFQTERVAVARDHDQGLEAAARAARYQALRRHLDHGEVLLTAHHADDQVETVLLALLRGAGVQGLVAMPACTPFANGWHVRPLLEFSRAQLAQWARSQGIDAVEDPANLDPRFDRNFLRHAVLPRLRERWPGYIATVTRSARHLGEAAELLAELAAHDLQLAAVGPCLDVAALKLLSETRRRNLLRYWVRLHGLDAPSARKLRALEHDMLAAADDRNPRIDWRGAEVHRHRRLLYATQSAPAPPSTPRAWAWREPLEWSPGRLRLTPSQHGLAAARLPATLTVRTRCEGDELRVAGRDHRRQLKKLLQELNVLPWRRDCLPIVCADEQIVAVADLCIAQEFAAAPGEAALQVTWEDQPRVLAVRS